mgnify:CR=1 FL=1
MHYLATCSLFKVQNRKALFFCLQTVIKNVNYFFSHFPKLAQLLNYDIFS